MTPISFSEVARLVNRVSGTRIDVDSPRELETDQYAIYSGAVSSSGFSFEFEILYIYAGATKDGIRSARATLERKTDKTKIKIVYAPSVTPGIIDELKKTGIQCISLADYFLSFMSQQTETYIDNIRQLSFKDYIDPQIESPTGFIKKIPNPVLGFITTPERSSTHGEVAVLLGEPGQGKTHMSKYLAVELANRKNIPIYVHSEQWTKMQGEDLSSIWKTIVASFRYFEAPIGWAEGVERDFIRVSLRLGIFRLIFDGFDEFILWNRGTVDPRDSLQELINLAEETGTTLCITSRTSFWKSEIVESNQDQGTPSQQNIYEFIICPFDSNHAKNYFNKRFGDNKENSEAAVKLFNYLKQDNSPDAMNFVGRGFFLTLIADLISRGFSPDRISDDRQTRIQWIMNALCQREKTRQQLPIDASMQLTVLREFAEMTAKGESRSTATLQFILEVLTDLDQKQIDQLIKNPAKLKDHPLIRYIRNLNSWVYTQDQIEYALLAERILELSLNTSNHSQLTGLLNHPKFSQNLQTEVATAIVQQVFETRSIEDALTKCKEIIRVVSSISLDTSSTDTINGHHAFAGQLALFAANRSHTRGADRLERTNALLNLLPAGQLTGLHFVGTMSGFDLRDLTISDCNFDTVTFTNCRFSATTRFINCRFSELRVVNCQQFGLTYWDNSNNLDDISKKLVDAEMISAGRRAYGDENLSDDIDCLIHRFLPRETSGFKNVEERNLSRGLIGHSQHKDLIIETFKKSCLVSHPVAGIIAHSVAEHCKADFIFYVGNGVFTGNLANLFNDLRKKIGLTI